MIKRTLITITLSVLMVSNVSAKEIEISAEDSVTVAQNRRPQQRSRRTTGGSAPHARAMLKQALDQARAKRYLEASNNLFALSRRAELKAERMQIKYILGLMLFEMGLDQVAAFQFVDVVREGSNEYVQQALEKLAIAADRLGDDTLLNYAISQVRLDQFPAAHQDMLNFRIGEIQLQAGSFDVAARHFSRVEPNSRYGSTANYNEALAYAMGGKLDQAANSYRALIRRRSVDGITNNERVAGIMGLARVLYQQQEWDRSLAVYREVPRDTPYWHDALFESSWAMMRSGRFRSALSNFQSLHSPYYETFYIPESLILRGIVYLYICRYDEMEKTLNLFEAAYEPARTEVDRFIGSVGTAEGYYNELARALIVREELKDGKEPSQTLRLPYLVARHVLNEGDIKRGFSYLERLQKEQNRFDSLSSGWKGSPIGQYSSKILANRLSNTQKLIGERARIHLRRISLELRDFSEQAGFLKFEMISGQREQVKKSMVTDAEASHVDAEVDRTFYIQNGFEYWPFKGEYWLDEIGNYHYLGRRSCE